jgi:hypothetical protein
MILIWLLAIYTVGIATFVYGLQVKQAYPGFVAPRVRVGTSGLEGRAGQRYHRHCRRADDLRVSLRSDRHDAD